MEDWPEFATIADVTRLWREQRGNHVALIQGDKRWSYAELDRRSNRIANRLLACAEDTARPVSYLGINSALVFEVWFAAAKLGLIFAPLNWRLAPAELDAVLADARPAVLFVDRAHAEMIGNLAAIAHSGCELVLFDAADPAAAVDPWLGDVSERDPQLSVAGDTPCLLGYTSGTTGTPKGVAMSHIAFVEGFNAGREQAAMAWANDDIVAMAMPNFHLGGSFLSMQALMTGATLTILPTFEIGALLQTIAKDGVTILPIVPTALQMLLEDGRLEDADTATIRKIVYFGSPIGYETVRRAREAFDAGLVQYYGTTETWILTFLPPEDHLGNSGRLSSCGKPVPGVDLRLIDEDGNDVAAGEIGEVAVRSRSMFEGYWGQPEATAQAFDRGWYRTGDLGKIDEDGYYYLVDRAKDMIVSGGENVYSTEVELAIARYPGVSMVAVVGMPDPLWGEKVTAVVVADPELEIDEEDLRRHCRSQLAGYKLPKHIFFRPHLPLTANGKIHKPTLREQLVGADR